MLRSDIAAELVGNHKSDAGCLHHIVDTLARQRGFGRHVGRAAFQHGQHRGYHFDTMTHDDSDELMTFAMKLLHDGVGEPVEPVESYRAAILHHRRGIRLAGRPL